MHRKKENTDGKPEKEKQIERKTSRDKTEVEYKNKEQNKLGATMSTGNTKTWKTQLELMTAQTSKS